MLKKKDISVLDYYKLARDQIVHEDNLINSRTNWLLTSQSFLLAAYAVIFKLNIEQSPVFSDFKILVWLVPLISLIITLSIGLSIYGAIKSMEEIKTKWDDKLKEISEDKSKELVDREEEMDLPPIHCDYWTGKLGGTAFYVIPLVFITAWFIILLWAVIHTTSNCSISF